MHFKNLKTGNIVSSENPITVELMKNSDNYEPVKDTPKKPASKSGAKAEGDTATDQ
jgi:hypothetical protein